MILLVDGNNLAHRVFHTNSGSLTTKAGEPSGVILGVLNSIKGLIEKFPETTKVIMCWDGGRSEWRKELYPQYKAQRDYGKADPEKAKKYEGLWSQMESLHENLHIFGVNSIKVQGQEADDIIAVACNEITEQYNGEKHVMVITSDKDMLQLASDNVSIYTPYKDKVISPLNFYDETGVTQEAYLGYRALVGDTSDNIMGVPGIGDKTAKNLMNKWGHIDNILSSKGNDRQVLMKSKRTAKIFENQNLQVLGINNKIMNFKFVPYDVDVEDAINKALNVHLTGIEETRPSPVELNSRAVKDYFIRWQFLNNLTNYMTWIVPFMGLGEDE